MNIEKTIAYLMGLVDDCIERAVTTQTVPKLGRNTIESHLRAALQCKACPVTLEGYSPSSVAVQQGVQADTPTDDELRMMWIAAGGDFFGPKTVTCSMPESKLLPLLRRFATHSTQQGLEAIVESIREVFAETCDAAVAGAKETGQNAKQKGERDVQLVAGGAAKQAELLAIYFRGSEFTPVLHAAIAAQAKQGV